MVRESGVGDVTEVLKPLLSHVRCLMPTNRPRFCTCKANRSCRCIGICHPLAGFAPFGPTCLFEHIFLTSAKPSVASVKSACGGCFTRYEAGCPGLRNGVELLMTGRHILQVIELAFIASDITRSIIQVRTPIQARQITVK
jgi:hypothetical protein